MPENPPDAPKNLAAQMLGKLGGSVRSKAQRKHSLEALAKGRAKLARQRKQAKKGAR